MIKKFAYKPALLLFLLLPFQLAQGRGLLTPKESAHRWIETANGIASESGDTLRLTPSGNMHWVVLDRKISLPYEISFQEKVAPEHGSVAFLWNYNLYDAAFKKRVSTGFNQRIEINRSGKIDYVENIFKRRKITGPGQTIRSWRIVNQKRKTTIYLNGKKVIEAPADDPATVIPAFAIQLHDTAGAEFEIKAIQITDTPDGIRKKPVIYQYQLPDENGRIMTVFAHENLTADQKKAVEELPRLFRSVEIAGGSPITHTDPIVAIYEKVASGNNLAATPGYPGWLEVGPTMLSHLHLIAHEFAHFYFCLGASCGSSMDLSGTDIKEAAKAAVAGNWMIEGFASYLGMLGLNRLLDRPENTYAKEFGDYFGHADQIRVGGWYDGPLSDGAKIKTKYVPPGEKPIDVAFNLAYGKGYRFFYMIGTVFGHDTIRKIIRNNLEKRTKQYTAEALMHDLETLTGKPAKPYFAGWIYPGKYQKERPTDFVDQNGNGIIDFAEPDGE